MKAINVLAALAVVALAGCSPDGFAVPVPRHTTAPAPATSPQPGGVAVAVQVGQDATPTPGASPEPTPMASASSPAGWLAAAQKRRAEAITSVFENDTPTLQYAFIKALGDGRGYTCGRAGFTTGTGDALEVVRGYVATVPESPLAAFLPRLEALAEAHDPALTGLDGFPAAWSAAADDPAFRAAQDAVVDRLYYQPAMRLADQLGLQTALARAALYDAIIQHGDGPDPDGLPALVAAAGPAPATGTDEHAWLAAFLAARRADLANAHDPATREGWAQSVDRVDAFTALLAARNDGLVGPISIATPDHQAVIP